MKDVLTVKVKETDEGGFLAEIFLPAPSGAEQAPSKVCYADKFPSVMAKVSRASKKLMEKK